MGQALAGMENLDPDTLQPLPQENENNNNNNGGNNNQNNNNNAVVDSPSTTAATDFSTYVATCSRCTKPLFPFSAILPQRIAVWSKTVYSYTLEDVLPPDSETGEGCYVYSATNPGAHRFDVVRVSAEKQWREVTVDIDVKSYTPSHSWFPGYSWSMVGCGSCGSHVGWAFSPTQPGDRRLPRQAGDTEDADEEEAAIAQAHAEHAEQQQEQQEQQQQQAEQEAPDRRQRQTDDEDDQQQQNNDDDEAPKEPESDSSKQKKNIRFPAFIGVIFANIRANEMPRTEFDAFVEKLSSLEFKTGLVMTRDAWPALTDNLRRGVLDGFQRMLRIVDADDDDNNNNASASSSASGDDATEKAEQQRQRLRTATTVALPMVVRHFSELLQMAGAYVRRVRERQARGEAIERHSIPFLRPEIEEDYVVSEAETEAAVRKDLGFVKIAENSDDDCSSSLSSSSENDPLVMVELIRRFNARWDSVVPQAPAALFRAADDEADLDMDIVDEDDEEEAQQQLPEDMLLQELMDEFDAVGDEEEDDEEQQAGGRHEQEEEEEEGADVAAGGEDQQDDGEDEDDSSSDDDGGASDGGADDELPADEQHRDVD